MPAAAVIPTSGMYAQFVVVKMFVVDLIVHTLLKLEMDEDFCIVLGRGEILVSLEDNLKRKYGSNTLSLIKSEGLGFEGD